MSASDPKPILLPVKFAFTEAGTTVMMRQKRKMSRLKMGDNTDDYGIVLDNALPIFVQGLITSDYVSKIEVSGVEPMESRSSIIELSKAIVYGVLFRNYASASQEQVLASESVKKWNHANPSLVIDEKTQSQQLGLIQTFMERHPEELSTLKKELIAPVYQEIENDTTIEAEDKTARQGLLNSYVSAMSHLSWFALLKFRKTPDYQLMLQRVRFSLKEFLGKTNIAEYTGLMLMELATNIINILITKEAKMLFRGQPVDTKKALNDAKIRMQVINSLRNKNNLLSFSWKLGGARMAKGSRGRFQILLYDTETNFAEPRGNVDQTKATDASRSTLSEYYTNLHGSGNELDLGMFYLSFLDEACDKMGIKFESMVNQYGGQTITTLTFTL
jgi:hypothetical protein